MRSGLTVYFVLSPENGSLASVACGYHRKLDASTAASGPHDFAVRLMRVRLAHSASTASHRAFVTIASRPSCRVGRHINELIWVRTKGEYFFAKGWTTQIALIRRANLGSARGASTRAPATPKRHSWPVPRRLLGRPSHRPENGVGEDSLVARVLPD